MVLAYTKEQAIELLKRRPIKTSENDLKGIFELAGLQIKEYENTGKGWVSFEIHHRQIHVITYREGLELTLGDFSHRFVRFPNSDGISMAIESNKELMAVVFKMIMPALGLDHQGVNYDDEIFEHTLDDLQVVSDAIVNELNKED